MGKGELRRPDSTPTADPYLPRCSFKGSWDRRQLLHVRSWKLRRSADDRLLLGADAEDIHISRNVVKRDYFSLWEKVAKTHACFSYL